MKVLLVGAGEFFAPFIVDDLASRRADIAVLTLSRFDFGETVHRFEGDGADPDDLQSAIDSCRPDVVVDLLHHNSEHATRLLSLCRKRVSRTIHLSSLAVFAENIVCPVDETTEMADSRVCPSQLARRIEADEVVQAAIDNDEPAVLVRLPELYGPRDPRSAEWFFAKRALDNRKQIALPDGGLALRHRGFVQNMARGVVQAVSSARAPSQIFHLGEIKLATLAQLARGVARALDHDWDLYSVPGRLWRTPYDRTCFYDLRKSRTQLRYDDGMIPRDGLELTLAWLCQHPPSNDWRLPEIPEPFDYSQEDNLIAEFGHKIDL